MMPRRKTVQPSPLQTITLEDGTVIEVRDETCRVIGRGSHKRDAFEEKRDRILERVVSDYFKLDITDPNRERYLFKARKSHDYLKNASTFARQCEYWGYGGKEGEDDSALRKKMYPEVLRNIRAFRNALEEKYKNT